MPYPSEGALFFTCVSGGYHVPVVFMSFLRKQKSQSRSVRVGNKHNINLTLNVKERKKKTPGDSVLTQEWRGWGAFGEKLMKRSLESLFQDCCIHYADCKACICSAHRNQKSFTFKIFWGG